jgi:hypothetical protein
MNIRSLSNPAQVLAKDKLEASKTIRSDGADEREANGQQTYGDAESYRSLTDEEIEQVIEKILSNEGIQKSGLIVKPYKENNQNLVKLETPDGKVVKRFIERDLFFFLFNTSKDDIQLVNKTA